MTATRRRTTCLAGFLAGVPAMLAGLFALEVHPIGGTLMILAAMALLLSSAAEFCQEHGIYETYPQEKQ